MPRCAVRIGLLVALGVHSLASSACGAPERAVPYTPQSAAPATGKRATPVPRKPSALFSGINPEERLRLGEERKRISAAAAAAGTDPTAIIGYYQATYGHNDFSRGLSTNSAAAVVRLPLTPNWLFQVTLPYVWADMNRPKGGFSVNGTSDLSLRTGGRVYASEDIALFVGIDASFPAASERRLGTAKYTLGPGVALAAPLPRLHSLSFILLQDYNSVGGTPAAARLTTCKSSRPSTHSGPNTGGAS
jgi:hypothetical protein